MIDFYFVDDLGKIMTQHPPKQTERMSVEKLDKKGLYDIILVSKRGYDCFFGEGADEVMKRVSCARVGVMVFLATSGRQSDQHREANLAGAA